MCRNGRNEGGQPRHPTREQITEKSGYGERYGRTRDGGRIGISGERTSYPRDRFWAVGKALSFLGTHAMHLTTDRATAYFPVLRPAYIRFLLHRLHVSFSTPSTAEQHSLLTNVGKL